MSESIKAVGITKTFGSGGSRVDALRGIDLSVEPGEFVAIMGPSGCGKSSLLHILGGLDHATGGELWLGDQRVDRLPEASWAVTRRNRIGFVFQSFNLVTNLTVAQNVEIPALVAGRSSSDAKRRRMELLDQLGLSDRANAMPSELSGGQMQRAAIARALVNEPGILLADEPTGNLDSHAAEEVRRIFRERHEAGQTIILVTHDLRVAATAGRVVHLLDGQINGEDRVDSEQDATRLLSRMVLSEVQA